MNGMSKLASPLPSNFSCFFLTVGVGVQNIRKTFQNKIRTWTLFSDRSQAGHQRPVFENGIVANLLPNLWTIFSHSYLSGTTAFYGWKNIAQFWVGSPDGIIWICRSYIDQDSKVNSKLKKKCLLFNYRTGIWQALMHNANICEFSIDLHSAICKNCLF